MISIEKKLMKADMSHEAKMNSLKNILRKPIFVNSVILLLIVFDFLTIHAPIDALFTQNMIFSWALAIVTASILELVPTFTSYVIKYEKDKKRKQILLIIFTIIFGIVFLGVGVLRISTSRELFEEGKALNVNGITQDTKPLTFGQYAGNTFLFFIPFATSVIAFFLSLISVSVDELRLEQLYKRKRILEEGKAYLMRERTLIARCFELIDDKEDLFHNRLLEYENYLLEICKLELARFINQPEFIDKTLTPNYNYNQGAKILSFENSLNRETHMNTFEKISETNL